MTLLIRYSAAALLFSCRYEPAAWSLAGGVAHGLWLCLLPEKRAGCLYLHTVAFACNEMKGNLIGQCSQEGLPARGCASHSQLPRTHFVPSAVSIGTVIMQHLEMQKPE